MLMSNQEWNLGSDELMQIKWIDSNGERPRIREQFEQPARLWIGSS